ncbi:hypothetical protein B0G77_3966 [Paraburkholderia sp. BL10I2N1]|nr:hypothetical protein B0G77_3966 [Paraburkholderia sp. BL10I2N1]
MSGFDPEVQCRWVNDEAAGHEARLRVRAGGPQVEVRGALLETRRRSDLVVGGEQDLTPSQVVRQLIREYLEQHGVTYKTKNVIGARPRRKTA